MPYIPKEHRYHLLNVVTEPGDPGELAFLIYRLCRRYIRPDASYKDRSSVVGVLETVKHEFMRQNLDEYEDRRRSINGDV